MTDRINAAERAEAAEVVRGLSRVGVELADFSLNNLEARLANGFDQSRLDRMTPEDLSILQRLTTSFQALSNSPEAVNAYTLAKFKDDFLYLTEFLAEPLKSEIANTVRATDQTGFNTLQQRWIAASTAEAARVAARNGQGATLDAPTEIVGMGQNRLNFLAGPELEIGSLIQQIIPSLEGLNNAQKMARLREALVPKIVEILQAWGDRNADFEANLVEGVTGNWEDQYWARPENGGVTSVAQSTLGRATTGGLNVAGNLFGDVMANSGRLNLSDDPALQYLFPDESSGASILAALKAGNFSAENFRGLINERLVVLFPDNLEFDRVTENFGTWSGLTNEQLTAEDLQKIQEKLQTIPRFFIGGEWEDKYHEYVRNEIAGRGALDFPEWIMTQVDGIQAMLFRIVLMLTPALNWWYNDSEDTDEQRYGEHWAIYDALEASAPTERGGLRTDQDPPGSETDNEAALIAVNSGYGVLLSRFRETITPPAQMLINLNGEPLSAENLPANADFNSLLAMAADPKSAPIFTHGVELDDLFFVSSHRGNNASGDGMNFYFENNGVQMSYDFQELGYYTNLIDELVGAGLGAGAIAWLTGAGLASGPLGWLGLAAGAAVGTGAAYLLDLDGGDTITSWTDGKEFSFADFSAADFHAAIEEMKHDVGLIEAAFTNIKLENIGPYIDDFETYRNRFDLPNIQSFPPEMFSEDGISPAFQDLLALPDQFWGDYKMNQSDINTFASELDTGFFSLGSINNEAGAIAQNEGWIWDSEGYEIDGSGWLWDTEISTAQEFFNWLHS